MGVVLVLLLVGVAIVRRSCSYSRKSFAEKTLASSSGEGLDPDVVQSIKRLDVVSCVQEEHTKEETDPMFTSPEQRYPQNDEETPHEMHQFTVERKGGEVLSGQMQAYSFDSPRQHRSYDRERQRLNLSQEQSEDSGVSESESDNELKLPEAEGNLSSIPRPQGESDPSYIALPLSRAERSKDQGLSARDSGSRHPCFLTDMITKCSSTKELYGISEGAGPVSRRPYERSPSGIPLRQMSSDLSSRYRIQTSPPARIHCIDRSDIGVPVTLYKADNGELHLLPRTPSDYEGTEVQLSATPVYTITTLPKATGKENKTYSETRSKEKDPSQI